MMKYLQAAFFSFVIDLSAPQFSVHFYVQVLAAQEDEGRVHTIRKVCRLGLAEDHVFALQLYQNESKASLGIDFYLASSSKWLCIMWNFASAFNSGERTWSGIHSISF